MSAKQVCVVGAINADLVIEIDPDTVGDHYANASTFSTLPGGKGLNAALTLAQLSPQVAGFVGRIGDDIYGSFIESTIENSALEAVTVQRDSSRHTGIGHVRIHPGGDYDTVVLPGANAALGFDDVQPHLEHYPNVDMWVTNLETPLDWLERAVAITPNARVAINVSPINHLVTEAFEKADIVVMNEDEAQRAADVERDVTGNELVEALRKITDATIVVTAGERGAYGAQPDGATVFVEAVPVSVVTTVGAGDSFFATLCLALSEGRTLLDAMDIGARAGAAVASSAHNFLTPDTVEEFITSTNQPIWKTKG